MIRATGFHDPCSVNEADFAEAFQVEGQPKASGPLQSNRGER